MAYRDDVPTILIFGDSEDGLAAASDAAITNGGRIAAVLPLASATDRLESQVAVDLVIVDVSVDHGQLLDRLFRHIQDGVNDQRFASIVTIAPDLIDAVSARLDHADVSLLVGHHRAPLVQAVAAGIARRRPQLGEPDEDDAARQVASASFGGGGFRALSGHPGDGPVYDAFLEGVAALVAENLEMPDLAVIRGIIRARRLRHNFFGSGMFADPAWDILLDLLAARIEGRSVAVSSLCIAAAVPATTALRWIKQLTAAGLLRRVADCRDGRRVFIELTDEALATLTAYFAALVRDARLN